MKEFGLILICLYMQLQISQTEVTKLGGRYNPKSNQIKIDKFLIENIFIAISYFKYVDSRNLQTDSLS